MSKTVDHDDFAAAAQKFNCTEPGDYYHKEFESKLDHNEDDKQISDIARYFFFAGVEAQKALQEVNLDTSLKGK